MRLDELLPRWDFGERHRIALEAPTESVMRAVEEVTWAEVPAFRRLMQARTLGRLELAGDRPILASMTGWVFTVLDRTADELVVGATQGQVQIGFNFRYAGGELTTETRVLAEDRRARRLFLLYWTVIRLPSGLIRRVWLGAIRNRAGGPGSAGPQAGR
jgi:hypothetical protein